MSTGLAPDLVTALLRYLGNEAVMPTPPTTLHIKLHIGDPGPAGTANPAVNTTRQPVSFEVAVGSVMANDAALAWAAVPATEDYTHFTIWTSATVGSFIASGTLTSPPTTIGTDFDLAIGDLVLSVPGVAT